MKKTIRKIVSKVLATVTAIATLASPIAPSITVHAEAATPADYIILSLEDVECSVSDGVLYIDHIKNNTSGASIQMSLLDEYKEAHAGTDLTELIVKSTAFNDLNGKVRLGQDVGFDKITGQSLITVIDFEGNNTFESGTLEEVFTDVSKLETVTGFSNVINSVNNSEVSLIKTFNNCKSLKTVDIDLTSSSKSLRLNSTFNNCPSLETVTFTNANFKDMLYLTGYDTEGSYSKDATFDFNQCYFPSDEDDTFDNVFKNFTGTINLDGCGCVSSDAVFALKKFVAGPSEAVGDLTLNFTDSKIGEIDNLINGGSYNNVTLVSVVGNKTERVNTIFGSNTKVSGNINVTNNNAASLKELVAPYYGLNMDNENAEVTAVDLFLRSINLKNITAYNTIGHTYNVNYSDLSSLDLNQSAEAVYYETSSDLSFSSYYVPEKFVTAHSFGGTYYLPFEAWEVIGEENFSKVEEDGLVDIPLANRDDSTIKGHQYNNGKLKNSTEYTHSKATVKFTDVYTDTIRTTYCTGGTVITSVLGYDETINYFTDESLETPFVAEGFIVEEDTVLQLYYTTEEGAGGGSDVPGDDTIDKQLSVTFVNAESSDIPSTLNVSWKAIGGTVSDSGTTSVSIDKTKTTQMITVPVPSVVEGITELTYEFTIADVEGFDITKASDGITFTLTKKAATPPVEEEPDYSVIYDMPTKCSFDIPNDLTKVTATFEDGTSGPLAKDGSIIKFTLDEVSTPDAYGQTSEFANFSNKQFFTVSIEVNDGDTTRVVKSLNTQLTGIYYNQYSYIDSKLSAVFYYGDSTNKTPTRLLSSWYDLGGSDYIQFQFDKTGYFVELFSGARYNNTEKTAKYTINWDDAGNENKRPTTVVLEWTAQIPNHVFDPNDEDDSTTGTCSVPVDKSVSVQSGTFKYPAKLGDSYVLDAHIERVEVADIPNYTATVVQGTSACTITLTYVPTPLEPIVEDIPEGVSINFGKDIEDITATLADGTTKPLGSDDTSLIVSVDPKAQTVYQSPKNQTFDKILFYDVTLTLTDGTSEWKVKSIDSPMGIAIPLPSDCGSTANIKVWHYDNGIMTEPTEVQNKSVTSAHVVIPTTSYSYYAVSYNVGDTEQKTITINWDDEGHESERPTSVVADWTATYADDSTKEGTAVFNRDNTVDKQTTTISVPKTNSGSSLVSTAANIRAVTGYEVVTTPGDPLTFTLKYVGNTASYVTVTFGVELLNTPTGTKLPNSVPLTVYTWYTDGTKDTYNTTIDIGSTGTGSKAVERPIKNADGSAYLRTTWSWGDVDSYTLTNKTSYAVYEYDGSSTSIQTVYPVTIKFNGDSTDKTKRPTSLTVTWTATTNTSNTVSTGTTNVNITNASDSFSQNITIPDTTGEQRTVTFTGPVLEGYNMNVNGSTITYTYNVKTATNTSYEIIFDDEDNKSGRRPAELTVTFADTTNSSNTITSKLTIAENTTTKVKTYKGNISIPAGTTYAITKVETLPEGYKASISGLSATLKYTPEKINKTFKIEWKNDVEDVRPSSVTVKVKSGDIEGATLTLKKDTNWAASTDLLKYIKGVEASWTAEASSVTNYSASVSGETITMTYTGTLTEAQKEAINATDKDGSEKEKEQLYDFEKFDWIDYANRYPDVKKAFGYNKEALYAHYIHYGIAEGRIATWTGKYENVNEDILKAYFPNDYKYKVENSSSADQMLEDMGGGSSNSTNSSDKSNVTVDENGNTIIKTDNGDGTTTETVIDKDGNVVQTKTYATGDNRMASMTWIYFAIIAVALCLGVVCYRDFRVSDKNRKFVDSHLKS